MTEDLKQGPCQVPKSRVTRPLFNCCALGNSNFIKIFRNVRTGSILCSYQIKDIDAVFSGPYLSYDNSNREWITTENQPFSVSL